MANSTNPITKLMPIEALKAASRKTRMSIRGRS